MIKKIKASLHEKLILIFLILLGVFALSFTILIKNKCLFVKNFDPQKINFEKPRNIVVLNAECGNVIIELYPEISPNGVERFKKLIKPIKERMALIGTRNKKTIAKLSC